MTLVHPVNEKKRAELESELESQKKIFLDASRRSTAAVQRDLELTQWIREYPLWIAAALFVGGKWLAFKILENYSLSKRRRNFLTCSSKRS